MLKIRLQRVGRKHEPTFRIVLTESENSTKSGRLKEVLGSYDPRKSNEQIKTDRVKYWLDKGVKVTGTVHNLFVTHKILNSKKINVLPKKTPIIKEAPAEAAPAAAPAPEAAPVAEAPVETTPEAAPETAPESTEAETPAA